MDSLHQKLQLQGLQDVVFMVVNHQGEPAQRLHSMLHQRLSDNITLYQQDGLQPDVWTTLRGDKDDFLVYDRCGRLTHHISLPYSIIGQGHIENAIKDTYCKRPCGECTHEASETPAECSAAASQPDTVPAGGDDAGHGHHHGQHHSPEHHHGHGHHGHGHHGHGHHGDGHHGDGHGVNHHGQGHGQHHDGQVGVGLDLGQQAVQQAVQQAPQEVLRAPGGL